MDMQKMMLTAAATLVAITAWFAFQRSNTETTTGTAAIEGRITDAITQMPVVDARVTVNGNDWYAPDTTGKYVIGQLPGGTYTLRVQAAGYAEVQLPVKLQDAETQTLDIALSLATLSLADTTMTTTYKQQDHPEKPVTLHKKAMLYEVVETDDAASYGNAYASPMYEDAEEIYFPGTDHESYDVISENTFKKSISDPLSTFSIDVDNASYSNIRRFISYGQNIPTDAVRIEEMVNYFDYTYAQPKGNDPFAIQYELSDCPWNPESQLLMIGIQGKDIDYTTAAASNLVFLIDVSGSMGAENKLPLVKSSLKHLVDQLRPTDRVALVVYAGAAGEVLPSTACTNKQAIHDAIDRLESGGSTAGGAGIQLAYDIAVKNRIDGGNNRVILCTDGDFNVGANSDADMQHLIEEKRNSGVFITVCGFGMGNYKDSKMEKIADNGNGAYYYIDTQAEARKVFGTDMRGTLFTIAKDVKIQVEFNPALVESYRLIGYENRKLNNEDFNDDKKDAGELGAGHRVTALYEIRRTGKVWQPGTMSPEKVNEDLKYQSTTIKNSALNTQELMTLKLRYKEPDGSTSKYLEKALYNTPVDFAHTSDNFRFACGVVEFGMLLRNSEFKGDASMSEVLQLASGAKGADTNGLRAGFIDMVKQYSAQTANK